MTTIELARRQERAEHETLVIARTEDGFRVYAPTDPKRQYLVNEDDDGALCTCPDFQTHQDDPGWRCKHILAVTRHMTENGHAPESHASEERRAIQEESREPRKRKTATPPASAQMLLKRSVSPDGRIDALSVEFATPVSDITGSAIKAQATAMLAIQSEIVDDFLHRPPRPNVQAPNSNGRPAEEAKSPASPARVVGVGGMDGKWGRRLFLTIEQDGKRLRLFGNRKQLGEHLTMAGYPDIAHTLSEGTDLDLPCRVVTKPSTDGGYINIERLLPANGQVRS